MRIPAVDDDRLHIGEEYHMDEIEDVFDSRGFMAGINPRKDAYDELEYIVLTSTGDSHYADDHRGDRIRYIGQDHGEGDQPRTGRNGRLIAQSEDLTVPIYFFRRARKGDNWEYVGLVDVVEQEYISDGERMINRFLLEKMGISSPRTFTEAEAELEEERDDPPLEEAEEQYQDLGKRKARSALFRRRVKRYYDETCAICGATRRTPEGAAEVEAAHIYPRRENGRDHYRNGIALCRLHHWAFDSGWLSVSDDYEILVWPDSEREEFDEFASLDGESVKLPSNEDHWPLPKFLKRHRELHNFD